MSDEKPTQSKSQYLWSVAGKKLGYMLAKGVTALASSAFATHLAYQLGWEIQLPTLQAGAAGVALLATEWLHDFLKVKTGKSWL